MKSFTWKNKDSWLDYGIVIQEKPPMPVPERNADEIEVPGRDGTLIIDYETYKSITFSLVCSLTEDNLDDVKAWLTGFSDLIFSWQPDRYYKAENINRIDIAQATENYGEFPILFKAQPFANSLANDVITIAAPGTISNPGTAESEPIIKVYGTGNIDLTINTATMHLTNVADYVTIDSVLQDAYKDTVLKNSDMLGEFPVLAPGDNAISWTGTVTKIEITPNWRWL